MDEEYTLLTPENVILRYDVAGLGSRVVAATLDYLILAVGAIVLTIAGNFALVFLGGAAQSSAAGSALPSQYLAGIVRYGFLALTIIISFLFWWGYFVLCEVLWNGQSVGKKCLHLRVVRAGGQPVGLVASLVRNILRIIDLFLLLGVLVMLIDRSGRRLGDFAAGTLVIREPWVAARHGRTPAFASVTLPGIAEAQIAALPNAGRLTAAHYATLREFFARQPRLAPAQAQALAHRLAEELGQVLAVPLAERGDSAAFLATAIRVYEARHRYDDANG